MRIGTCTVDITPEPGVELCGFLARVQPSVNVHDPLAAWALYVSNGPSRLLWLHADLIALERSFVVELKGDIADRLGLSPDEIVVSTTHTHSGPPAIHLINSGSYDAGYVAWLKDRLLAAAAAALDRTEPAELLIAEGRCDLAVDRRGKPSAHTDPRVAVLAWRRQNGTLAAVLSNYSIHHVALRANNRFISADMAGRAAVAIGARLPGVPTVLVTNGACGNLNPPEAKSDFIQHLEPTPDFDQMERWGDRLANAVVTTVQNATVVHDAAVATELATFDLRFDTFEPDEVRQRATQLRDVMAGEAGYVADRYRDAIDLWERALLSQTAGRVAAPTAPLEIQLVRLGPVCLVCLAAEVFSVMADELRARVDGPLYVVGYANGDVGYLAPEVAYNEGGYEVESAFVFYGGLPVKRGQFERLRGRTVELLGSFLR